MFFQYSTVYAKAKITWQLATMAPKGTPWYNGLKNYSKAIRKETNGEFKIKLIPGGSLGSESNMFQKCKSGQIEMIGVNVHATSDIIKENEIFDLPFLINSYEDADKVYDRIFGLYMNTILLKHNLKYNLWSESGFFVIASKNKITDYKDIKNKTMRIIDNKINKAIWNSMGVKAIAIKAPEVLASMQSGLVNALESTLIYLIAASWFREFTYIINTYHKYTPAFIFSNLKEYNSLPDKYKKAMEKASELHSKPTVISLRQMNQSILNDLPKNNAILSFPDNKLKSDWKKDVKSVYTRAITTQTPLGKKLFRDIKKVLKKDK